MDGKAIPDFDGHFRPKDIRQRFAPMDVQVVQHQMNGLCLRVCHRQGHRNPSELEAPAIRCREGEMAARLRFYSTENIGGPATFLFVIQSRFSSWNCRRGGRRSACSVIGFSSTQITGSCRLYGRSYTSKMSSILAIYSSSRSATTHIFSRTASGRGSTEESEPFSFLHAE